MNATEAMPAATDSLDSVRNEIAERESKRERLQAQLVDARQEHTERRRALVESECTADDVVAAESRVGVLRSAIAEIDAELAPLRAKVDEEMARRAAAVQRRKDLEEVTELARNAAAHAQAYAAARARMIRAIEEAYDTMAIESRAALEATSAFDNRALQLGVSLHDVNESVPLAWITEFAGHLPRDARPYEHGELSRFYAKEVGEHFLAVPGRVGDVVNNIVRDARNGVPR